MATGGEPVVATAAPGRLAVIPRDVLFGHPERTSPAISPDGRRLAWLAPHQSATNVWVRDLDREGRERVVTGDRGRGIPSFTWAPDGQRILFPYDECGDENWRLCDVHLVTGVRRQLTPAGVQARIVKVSQRHPEGILVAVNLDQRESHDVYRLDLASGRLSTVCANPGFIGLFADEDLRVRAALAPSPEGGTLILVRDGDEDPWRPLLRVGYEDALCTRPLAFDPDGRRLLCITSHDANAAQLVWYELATGARTVVAADPTYDVSTAVLQVDTNEPRLVFVQRDRLDPVALDPSIVGDLAVLTRLGGDLQVLGSDHADRVWLVATIHDDGPTRYYLHHRDGRDPEHLFAHQPALDRYTLASMEPFATVARDGLALHGYLTFPPDQPRHALPAVLIVHGGPWRRDTWGFDAQAQWLANRGYLVIQVNFRGSTGYGKDFLNAGNRQWGAAMHDDLLDVLAWTLTQGWVDPERVGIYGGSYGGYAALVGAAFTPDAFRCAVAVAAPADLNSLLTSYPPYWKPVIAQAHLRVGNPHTEADFLWSRSPLSRVDNIRIPLMIVQGGNDPRVPAAETERVVAALRERGIPHVYLHYADEGHGLIKPANRLDFIAAAERFLAEHLGGRVEAPDALEDVRA